MEPAGFLDTNVFLRHIMQDHPEHSRASDRLFAQIEMGDLVVRTTDTVVFESVYTMERFYGMPRAVISSTLLALLSLPGIQLPGKTVYGEVFPLWLSRPGLSFADCFHLMMARQLGISRMISFDKKMSIPGVERVEPPLD